MLSTDSLFCIASISASDVKIDDDLGMFLLVTSRLKNPLSLNIVSICYEATYATNFENANQLINTNTLFPSNKVEIFSGRISSILFFSSSNLNCICPTVILSRFFTRNFYHCRLIDGIKARTTSIKIKFHEQK